MTHKKKANAFQPERGDRNAPTPLSPLGDATSSCVSDTVRGDVLVYWLAGELDTGVNALHLDVPLRGHRAVIVDLQSVTFFGSAALNALVHLRREATEVDVPVHLGAALDTQGQTEDALESQFALAPRLHDSGLHEIAGQPQWFSA